LLVILRHITAPGRRPVVEAGVRGGKIEGSKHRMPIEELRVHTETDAERVGTRADADTERCAEEDCETAEERRRSAYRLT
jgi:hypothetical protein